MSDFLLLKWGTIKGYCFEKSPEAFAALQKYSELGMTYSAMAQKDTPEQKQLICEMIDKVRGKVSNDWTGETYKNKEDAKKYVMDYGTENEKPTKLKPLHSK